MEDLKREIVIASKAIFWWRYTGSRWSRDNGDNKGIVYFIKAPFDKAEHLVKVEGSEGRRILWDKVNLLVVKFDSALEAYQSLPLWGCKQKTKDLGQAIVDAHIGVVWSKDE